jgi:hypothetical protein
MPGAGTTKDENEMDKTLFVGRKMLTDGILGHEWQLLSHER